MKNQKLIVDSKKIGFPIKIFENQYLEEALKGHFYFGSLEQYADIEKLTKDHVIGDLNEGKIVSEIEENAIWAREVGQKNPIRIDNHHRNNKVTIKYGISRKQLKQIGALCFSFLSLDDFQSFKKEGTKTYFKLKQEALDKVQNFLSLKEKSTMAECSLVLFNPNCFFKVLHDENLSFDWVHYYDHQDPMTLYDNQKLGIPSYFYKSQEYAYQRELRVVSKLSCECKGEVKTIEGLSGKKVSLNYLSRLVLIIEGYEKLD